MQHDDSRRLRGATAIIVLNWNRKDLLTDCLDSIAITRYPAYRVIVVDNGSSDGSSELVKERYPAFTLVQNESNLGFSGGINVGIRHALHNTSSEYIVLLNNDMVIVDPDWLSKMIGATKASERIGIVGCRLLAPPGKILEDTAKILPGFYVGGALRRLLPLPSQKVDESHASYETNVGGGGVLVKRVVFERVGLFNERYDPFCFEDAELCARARRAGFLIVQDGRVPILHTGSATLSQIDDEFSLFVYRRNLFRYVRQNFVGHFPFVMLLAYMACLLIPVYKTRSPTRLPFDVVRILYLTTRALIRSFG